MNIFLDGIVFSLQRQGGISVYFRELLSYLCTHEIPSVLLVEGHLQQDLCAANSAFSTVEYCRARILGRYRMCQLPDGDGVYHSSYYRSPNRRDVPTVVTVHDFIYERYQRGPRRWVHSTQKTEAIRAADAVICVSESTRQDLLRFVGETAGQKIYVIHNGVGNAFRNLSFRSSSAPFVLFVGSRVSYKNFGLVLAAMKFLPDTELHCVGGGPFLPQEFVNSTDSVLRRVRHLGFVSDSDLNVLYNTALCLVYPSSYEGFGIPVVEAMRAGCPVVCRDCDAVMEVGKDALTIVYEDDPRAIANAITETGSSARSMLIQKGFSVAHEYSWNTAHSQTIEVYRSLWNR